MAELAAMPKYEAYKDSGVEWLGDAPQHWDLLANKYIFKLKKNQVGKRSSEYDLLSLTLKGIIKRDMENPEGKFPAEFDTYQEVRTGDFVFCLFDVEETPRTVGLSKFDGMITGAYTVFEPSKEFNRGFLYYFYLNLDAKKRLRPLYRGLRNTIPKESFFGFKTFVPPQMEQAAIANFLDNKTKKIDEAIAIKEKQIELLKERKQIIIQQAVTQGLDTNAPMKDSGVDWIGEIPEHWEAKRIKHVAIIQNGQINPKDKKHKNKVLIAPNHIESRTGRILYKETADQQGAESGKYPVTKGALIYSKIRPELRKACIAEEDGMCSADMYSIIPNKQLDSHFMLLVFLGEKFNGLMVNQSMRVAMPKVNRNDVTNYWMAIPPLDEQDKIVKHVENQSNKIDQVIVFQAQQIEKLKEYKTTLINSAVTGKIKVTAEM